jgi:hypothetical protein
VSGSFTPVNKHGMIGLSPVVVPSCTSTNIYNVTTEDGSKNMDANYERVGMQFTGSEDQGLLESATFYLKKTGSPTGNITCQYYKNSLTSTETATETVDASSVGSSYAAFTFNFSQENEVEQNDIIAIVWTDGSTSNKINVATEYGLSTSDWRTADRDTREVGWTFSSSDSAKATIVGCQD